MMQEVIFENLQIFSTGITAMIDSDELKAKLGDKFLKWVTEAETTHSEMYEKWNKYDQYFANDQVPSGIS